MNYEWDGDKNAANVSKHGMAFEAMERAQWDAALLLEIQWDEDEEREAFVLPVRSSLCTVIITERHDALRIISLRFASNHEKKLWKMEFLHG